MWRVRCMRDLLVLDFGGWAVLRIIQKDCKFMFCFVSWQYEGEAKSPAVADEIGYVLLAEPSYTSEYALLECDLPYDFSDTAQIQRVPEQLADLLESAKRFPPALAIMRDEFGGTEPLSREVFTTQLIERLHWHLQNQRRQPFLLANAIITELGYKYAGRYYWIVGVHPYSPSYLVGWVSDDYHVYHDPIEHFDITVTELETRFLQKQPEPTHS